LVDQHSVNGNVANGIVRKSTRRCTLQLLTWNAEKVRNLVDSALEISVPLETVAKLLTGLLPSL